MNNIDLNEETKTFISDLIFDAAISKAIEDNRELLKPSMQHFINGGKVNGEFDIALKKLLRWAESKVIEAVKPMQPYSPDGKGELNDAIKIIYNCETAIHVLKTFCKKVNLTMGVEAAESILMEITKFLKSPSAASQGKQEAVEFAEWILDEQFEMYQDNGNRWWGKFKSDIDYKTEQLYQLFQTSKTINK